jgi:hypothetical protein
MGSRLITVGRVHSVAPWALAMMLLQGGCSTSSESDQIKPAIVRGVVTFHGRPLLRGTVTFLPVDGGPERVDPGIATIGPDGTFWVGNANLSKPAGLQPGRYKVTVLAMKPRPEGPKGPLAVLEIPERYTQESTTPIEITVKAGQNRVRLDLVEDGETLPLVQTENAGEGADSTPSVNK